MSGVDQMLLTESSDWPGWLTHGSLTLVAVDHVAHRRARPLPTAAVPVPAGVASRPGGFDTEGVLKTIDPLFAATRSPDASCLRPFYEREPKSGLLGEVPRQSHSGVIEGRIRRDDVQVSRSLAERLTSLSTCSG